MKADNKLSLSIDALASIRSRSEQQKKNAATSAMPSLKAENTILIQESEVISSEPYSLPWPSIALVELQLKIRQKITASRELHHPRGRL